MAMEVIEGNVREVEETLPAIRHDAESQAGTFALAAMTDDEFTTRLAALKRGRDRIATIQRELMDRDVDYGTIPGTPKPTLYKPGAEKLCDIYGLRADFLPERVIGDGATAPALSYQTRCELHLGSLDGPVVAVGYGSANSWERKHRYRRAERACPECGLVGALNRSKQGRAEWYCWAKKGGCGKTFRIDDPRVTDQPLGDVENPDPWDLDTTLLKMAEKRAHVDATLRATAASGLFTQDVEDMPRPEPPPPPPPPTIEDKVAQRRARAQEHPGGDPGPDEPPLPTPPHSGRGDPPEAARAAGADARAPIRADRRGSGDAGSVPRDVATSAPPHEAAPPGSPPAIASSAAQGSDSAAPHAAPDDPPGAGDEGPGAAVAPGPEPRCKAFSADHGGRCTREASHPGNHLASEGSWKEATT